MTHAIVSFGLLLLFAAPLVAQTNFHLDEPFQRPTKIPDGLLPLLRGEIKSTCQNDAAFQSTDARSLFVASRITLNHRKALILKSGHQCLTGGDNASFWVYVRTTQRYRLVLASGTISVDVLRTRSHGLRDIETNMATGAYGFRNIYKFNGSVYKARVCSEWEMHGLSRPKPHRVPCRRRPQTPPNKSLDASGGSVFRIIIGSAMLD